MRNHLFFIIFFCFIVSMVQGQSNEATALSNLHSHIIPNGPINDSMRIGISVEIANPVQLKSMDLKLGRSKGLGNIVTSNFNKVTENGTSYLESNGRRYLIAGNMINIFLVVARSSLAPINHITLNGKDISDAPITGIEGQIFYE